MVMEERFYRPVVTGTVKATRETSNPEMWKDVSRFGEDAAGTQIEAQRRGTADRKKE